jgi:hypothetical protein
MGAEDMPVELLPLPAAAIARVGARPEMLFTVKTYMRFRGLDPAAYSAKALQDLGKLTARLARQEGYSEAKVPEDGYEVHRWPSGRPSRPGVVPPATPRQIGYIMLLACERRRGHDFLARLSRPLNQDEAGQMIEQLVGHRRPERNPYYDEGEHR